jgi:hypothetical protein
MIIMFSPAILATVVIMGIALNSINPFGNKNL